jgi:flap endonuclease-1
MRDSKGNLTAHLLGILNRSIYLMERGVLPVWIFDGCPPELKFQVIKDRQSRREDAIEKLDTAIEQKNTERINKFSQRTTSVTNTMIEDAVILIRLLGLPYIEVFYINVRPQEKQKRNVRCYVRQGRFQQY